MSTTIPTTLTSVLTPDDQRRLEHRRRGIQELLNGAIHACLACELAVKELSSGDKKKAQTSSAAAAGGAKKSAPARRGRRGENADDSDDESDDGSNDSDDDHINGDGSRQKRKLSQKQIENYAQKRQLRDTGVVLASDTGSIRITDPTLARNSWFRDYEYYHYVDIDLSKDLGLQPLVPPEEQTLSAKKLLARLQDQNCCFKDPKDQRFLCVARVIGAQNGNDSQDRQLQLIPDSAKCGRASCANQAVLWRPLSQCFVVPSTRAELERTRKALAELAKDAGKEEDKKLQSMDAKAAAQYIAHSFKRN